MIYVSILDIIIWGVAIAVILSAINQLFFWKNK